MPLDGTKPSRALLVCLYADPEPYPGEDLERELRKRFDSVTTLRADTKFAKAENLKLPALDSYDTAILVLFVRVSDRKGDVDVPVDQFPLIQQIYKTGKPVISVGLGSPYLIERFPQAETWLSAFGIADVAQISVARALFGEIPIRGRLPVTIPGAELKAGYGMQLPANPMTLQAMNVRGEGLLKPAFDVIEKSHWRQSIPARVSLAASGYRGKLSVHGRRANRSTRRNRRVAINADTMRDIASLTKVVVTTTLVWKTGWRVTSLLRSILMRRSNVICRSGRMGRSRSGGTK